MLGEVEPDESHVEKSSFGTKVRIGAVQEILRRVEAIQPIS